MYLGRKINDLGRGTEADAERRVGLACGSAYANNTIHSRDFGYATKIEDYECLILGVIVYNAEALAVIAEAGIYLPHKRYLQLGYRIQNIRAENKSS